MIEVEDVGGVRGRPGRASREGGELLDVPLLRGAGRALALLVVGGGESESGGYE